jgi:hypothetical protein
MTLDEYINNWKIDKSKLIDELFVKYIKSSDLKYIVDIYHEKDGMLILALIYEITKDEKDNITNILYKDRAGLYYLEIPEKFKTDPSVLTLNKVFNLKISEIATIIGTIINKDENHIYKVKDILNN